MWFIFPQIDGLGHSETTRYYAIKSLDEARQYLQHPILGARLLQCVQALLSIDGISAHEIFGSPDDLKFRSCLTLFLYATSEELFRDALAKFYDSVEDPLTLSALRADRA